MQRRLDAAQGRVPEIQAREGAALDREQQIRAERDAAVSASEERCARPFGFSSRLASS